MINNKRIVVALLFAIPALVGFSQTNSPYTRYGYGDLSTQSAANSRGMGGLAIGLRDFNHINPVNPASYSAVDSLTFMFDAGVTIQNTNYIDGLAKLNVGNSSFDYVTMQFRLLPRIGITLGLLPYSNVGYNISRSVVNESMPTASGTQYYLGSGGLHQAFLGGGIEVLRNLSVGANVSYLWGNLQHIRLMDITDQNANDFQEVRYTDVRDVKFDLGMQYTQPIGKRTVVTLGAVFSPQINLNNTSFISRQTGQYGSSMIENRTDTTLTYQLPMSLGVGASVVYDRRLTIGVDYSLQKWADVKFMDKTNALYDGMKVAVGAEYLPQLYASNYFNAVKYRIGAYYSLPYYKVENGGSAYRASKEFGVSAGFTLPTAPRNRTRVNVAFQYVRVQGNRARMMDENIFRLSIGVTFIESWFFKRMI